MANLLFSINGRISRGPFWLVYLSLFPATLALMLFIEASAGNNHVLTLIAFVLYSWIAVCITVKRLHDLDATGWFSIPIVLIPIAVILVGSFLAPLAQIDLVPIRWKGKRWDKATNSLRGGINARNGAADNIAAIGDRRL
jgi:uncharacterized membrane protein YhaH (DUF805 family)